MTRKQQKKASSSRPQKHHFKLTVEGQEMVVEYTANSMPGLAADFLERREDFDHAVKANSTRMAL